MDTLTRKQLHGLAPGSAPRKNATKERLLDTEQWLADLAKYHFHPVFAMQGSSHKDGADPKDGRHLVVASDAAGRAYTLLNSHDRLMRCWAGMGLWNGKDVLIGKVVPVRRWTFSIGATEFDIDVESDRGQMLLTAGLRLEQAVRLSKDGYEGRGRPLPKALAEAVTSTLTVGKASALDTAFALVGAARKGNLAPSANAPMRRNVKGIRRPDAYQRLSLAAYRAALDLSL